MSPALAIPILISLPLAPPKGVTPDEHQALTHLFHASFGQPDGELNDLFERTCAKIVLTTPRFTERVEDYGFDVSVFPEPTSEPFPVATWTVADLLDAPTGATEETFVSRMGILPRCWQAEVEDVIHAWLEARITAVIGDEDQALVFAITDAYETPWLVTTWLEAQRPRPIAPLCARWGADVSEDAQIAALDATRSRAAAVRRLHAAQARAAQVAALLTHLHGGPLPRLEMPQRAVLESLCLRAGDHGLDADDLRAFAAHADGLSNRLRDYLAAWATQHLSGGMEPGT